MFTVVVMGIRNKECMRNEEHIFTLNMAYQIPNNLTHLTWKLWPQQVAFLMNSRPVSDNQERALYNPQLMNIVRQLRCKVKKYGEGAGRREGRGRESARRAPPTKLTGTTPLYRYSERSHLKTPGILSHGTLVFEKGSDEPFRSLTMLDLWLSAKSKLQGIGGGQETHCRPDLISTLSSALFTRTTYPTSWHCQTTHSPFPPSLKLPGAPSRQQWRMRDIF